MMIIGGLVGAVALIAGLVFVMGGGSERSKPRPAPTASARGARMSPEEARRLKKEATAELAIGDRLYRQATRFSFDSPDYAAKINEARGHLDKAMENFSRIPDSMKGRDIENSATHCGKLLNACFKVPIQM